VSVTGLKIVALFLQLLAPVAGRIIREVIAGR